MHSNFLLTLFNGTSAGEADDGESVKQDYPKSKTPQGRKVFKFLLIKNHKTMVQVKLFTERSNGGSAPIEKKINDFLQENEEKIVVKDIKYTAVSISDTLTWQTWAVMVIYELK